MEIKRLFYDYDKREWVLHKEPGSKQERYEAYENTAPNGVWIEHWLVEGGLRISIAFDEFTKQFAADHRILTAKKHLVTLKDLLCTQFDDETFEEHYGDIYNWLVNNDKESLQKTTNNTWWQ